MKAFATKTELAAAVAALEKAVGGSADSTITIEAQKADGEGGLYFTASNGEISIKTFAKADIGKSGALDTSGKAFIDSIKKITDEEITLEQQGEGEKDKRLAITYGAGQIKLPAMAPLMKHPIASGKSETVFTINTETFKSLVKRVCAFSAKDDSRPILKGINIQVKDGQLVAVGLDGYRLARITTDARWYSHSGTDIVVPSSALRAIAQLADAGTITFLSCNDGRLIRVESEEMSITTQLLAGQFIKAENIIPKSFTTETTFKREALMQALERSTIVSDSLNRIARLSIRDHEVRIKSESDAGLLEEVIEARTSGKEMEISFNAGYIMEIMKNFREEEATIKFNGPMSPAIAEEGDALYLALPMKVGG